MSDDSQQIVRTISVPAWMVYGATALIVVLSGGPISQLAIVSHQLYAVQNRIAANERNIAALQTKEQDVVSAINSLSSESRVNFQEIRKDLAEMTREVSVLKARSP